MCVVMLRLAVALAVHVGLALHLVILGLELVHLLRNDSPHQQR